MEITPIAYFYCNYQSKFGTPRQSGIIKNARGKVVFCGEYKNADTLRGIDEYSHLWLLWQFSENTEKGWSPTVRPPRLGGNKRMGVFATRSPFRPNSIGLSLVELAEVEKTEKDGTCLIVNGADLINGTPIFDIKPYLPYADCRIEAKGGFTERVEDKPLKSEIPEGLLLKLSADKVDILKQILENDPRPRYQNENAKEYRFEFAGKTVCFRVNGEKAVVTDILDI
ncbi:MAG: tRNA (N6-threonylcarbamoyladenosine(37)-N6)-methyltransferase TrmO [Clostridia bacterium]|nr:tRNA (N6-threonylcarbamoyladenosine(37)-N6)-methyltransferase TrmO [Clostridia bacterium]